MVTAKAAGKVVGKAAGKARTVRVAVRDSNLLELIVYKSAHRYECLEGLSKSIKSQIRALRAAGRCNTNKIDNELPIAYQQPVIARVLAKELR